MRTARNPELDREGASVLADEDAFRRMAAIFPVVAAGDLIAIAPLGMAIGVGNVAAHLMAIDGRVLAVTRPGLLSIGCRAATRRRSIIDARVVGGLQVVDPVFLHRLPAIVGQHIGAGRSRHGGHALGREAPVRDEGPIAEASVAILVAAVAE